MSFTLSLCCHLQFFLLSLYSLYFWLFFPLCSFLLFLPLPAALPKIKNPCPAFSKCAELEEELKNVTNNLKSLEAQAEKVGSVCVFHSSHSFSLDMLKKCLRSNRHLVPPPVSLLRVETNVLCHRGSRFTLYLACICPGVAAMNWFESQLCLGALNYKDLFGPHFYTCTI